MDTGWFRDPRCENSLEDRIGILGTRDVHARGPSLRQTGTWEDLAGSRAEAGWTIREGKTRRRRVVACVQGTGLYQ